MSDRIRAWLMRIFALDALLPTTAWAVPFLVRMIFPGARIAIELTAILLPISALFYRCNVGFRAIRENTLGRFVRALQFIAFAAGAIVLLVVDAVTVLLHVMPAQAFTREDYMILGILYACYLSAMAFAMYPGADAMTDDCVRDTA